LSTTRVLILVAAAASLSLGGCDKVKHLLGGKPSGQVVATVDGQEITTLELKAEMGGFAARDAKVQKAAEQQALQQIILRRLAAEEAKKQKLDKTPDYTIQVKRGEETLLAQAYERKLLQGLPPPTQREAENFVADHPDQFANRRILALDEIAAPMSRLDPKKYDPLKTLDEIKHQLDTDNVPYQEASGQLDTLTTPPATVAALGRLPPNAAFVLSQRGGVVVFARKAGEKVEPFKGDLATNYAMRVLGQQKQGDVLRGKLEALRKASESKIVYSPGFKPPAQPAGPGATPPAGAAAPPAAAAAPPPESPAAPAQK
jgi:EpsD family peptidyl-prolyl cis-trans isomerase